MYITTIAAIITVSILLYLGFNIKKKSPKFMANGLIFVIVGCLIVSIGNIFKLFSETELPMILFIITAIIWGYLAYQMYKQFKKYKKLINTDK
jgi:FtsH-binding integral membrane protein